MILRSRLALTALALASLLLSACMTGVRTTTAAATVSGVAAPVPPLIIGQLVDLSGSLASYGPPLRESAALAVEHLNRAGGALGAPVAMLTRDTVADPASGVAQARGLIEDDRAAVLLGAVGSAVTLAIAEQVAVPRRFLQISTASTSPLLTTLSDDDFLFRTAVSDAAQGVVLARLADELGFRTVAVLYVDNACGEHLAAQFRATFEQLGGTTAVYLAHQQGQEDYPQAVSALLEAAPDALVAVSYGAEMERFIPQALDGGYAGQILFAAIPGDSLRRSRRSAGSGWTARTAPLPAATRRRAATASRPTSRRRSGCPCPARP